MKSVGEKCNFQHSTAHFRKPIYRRKDLAKFFYASWFIAHFVSNFVTITTGVCRGNTQLAAFDGAFSKTPHRRKNLAKIFYARKVIAHFVSNFVAMAKMFGPEKMQLAAFDGAFPETFLWAQKFRENFLRKPICSPFCPKFCCHGNGGQSGKNAIFSIRRRISENLSRGAKISRKFLTQADL